VSGEEYGCVPLKHLREHPVLIDALIHTSLKEREKVPKAREARFQLEAGVKLSAPSCHLALFLVDSGLSSYRDLSEEIRPLHWPRTRKPTGISG
jgi:hypothetical protein